MYIPYNRGIIKLARKKEFDPLGGSISSEKPKKTRKENSILGSKEYTGSSSVYDEADHALLSDNGTDALTADGSSDKPKKRGFLSGIFGPGKSSRASDLSKRSGQSADFPTKDYAHIHEGEKYYQEITDIHEDDIFEKEPLEINGEKVTGPKPIQDPKLSKSYLAIEDPSERRRSEEEEEKSAHFSLEEKPISKKQTVKYHPNVCYLCGADTSTPHQQFRFGKEADPENTVPLCKTCMHAVTMLMKYKDPADEREIKSEWRFLAPGLNENRADEIVREGRSRN